MSGLGSRRGRGSRRIEPRPPQWTAARVCAVDDSLSIVTLALPDRAELFYGPQDDLVLLGEVSVNEWQAAWRTPRLSDRLCAVAEMLNRAGARVPDAALRA